MTGFPPGSLGALQFVAESAYGTIPTGAMAWAGDTQSFDPVVDLKPEFLNRPGSRRFGAVTRGIYDVSTTVSWFDQAGSEWTDFLALYGYGSTSGLADHLGDFTLQVDVFDGTTHNWHFLNGCKFNRADLVFTAPGEKIMFEAEIWAQWLQIEEHASSKAIAGQMQNVTPGADGAEPGGATLFWAGNSQINLAAGGLVDWLPTNMRLSVTQGLEREYGIKTGDDSRAYPVALALHEGLSDILFTAEVISQNQTYANSKRNADAITAITIPVDDEVITLANGEWDEPALPAYKQAVNREQISIRFPTLSIA